MNDKISAQIALTVKDGELQAKVNQQAAQLKPIPVKFTYTSQGIQTATYKELGKEYDAITTKLTNVNKATKTVTKTTLDYASAQKRTQREMSLAEDKVAGFQTKLINLKTTGGLSSDLFSKFNLILRNINTEFQQTGDIENFNKQMLSLKNDVSMASTEIKAMKQPLSEIIMKFTQWYLVAGIVTTVIGGVKQMVAEVIKLDNAMVELNKVFDASNSKLNAVKSQAFDMASQLGSTGEAVIRATTEFKRMGYSIEESLELAGIATTMTNVAEGITSTSEAANILVSVLKGTKTPVEYASSLLDRLNEVSNNNAVSFDALATMLQNSAAAMDLLGNNIDETIGLLVGGYEILQDNRVAKGIQTIGLRISGLNEDMEEQAGLANDVSKALMKYANIDIWDKETGQLKNTYTILGEVAEKWDEIGESAGHQEALLNILAGKQRADVAAAIIQNWNGVQSAVEDATNSMGSAAKEQEAYLNSIEGKTNNFKNIFQEFSDKIIGSQIVKSFIDIGSSILRVVGPVLTIVSNLLKLAGISIALEGIAKVLNVVGKVLEWISGLIEPIASALQSVYDFANYYIFFGWFDDLITGSDKASKKTKDLAETFEDATKQLTDYEKAVRKTSTQLSSLSGEMSEKLEILKEENEILNKQNDLQDKLLAVEKAREELAQAKNKRVRIFRAGVGFVYESDTSAVQDAQQTLADSLSELSEYKYEMALENADSFIKELNELLSSGDIIEGWDGLFSRFSGLLDSEFAIYIEEAQAFVNELNQTLSEAGIDAFSEKTRSGTLAQIEAKITELEKGNTSNDATTKKTIDALKKQYIQIKNADNNASGTESYSGGTTWVGENGPELMRLPQGTEILSNSRSLKLHDMVNNPSKYLNSKGNETILQFNGPLNFPNVKSNGDAQGFINELMQIGNQKIPKLA